MYFLHEAPTLRTRSGSARSSPSPCVLGDNTKYYIMNQHMVFEFTQMQDYDMECLSNTTTAILNDAKSYVTFDITIMRPSV